MCEQTIINRIQRFSMKVEAYLIAFVLTLGLLMMSGTPLAQADNYPMPHALAQNSNSLSGR